MTDPTGQRVSPCKRYRAEPAEPVAVPPAPPETTAFDKSRGWEAIIKWAYANNDDGVVAVRDIAKEFVDWRTRATKAEAKLRALEGKRA